MHRFTVFSMLMLVGIALNVSCVSQVTGDYEFPAANSGIAPDFDGLLPVVPADDTIVSRGSSSFRPDFNAPFDASPGYVPGITNSPATGELAWVIYNASPFHIPLPPTRVVLDLGGSDGELWLAAANYKRDAWDFYQLTGPYTDGMAVDLDAGQRYYRGDGQAYFAVITIAGSTLQCNGITVLPTADNVYFGDYHITNQTDMDGLASYVGIDGSLFFEAPALIDMTGLEGLEFVTGNFTTAALPNLISMAQLTSLRTVMGTFDVRQCANLTEISCPAYEWHGGWLWIFSNPKLATMNFPIMWSLTSFEFKHNDICTALAFPQLEEVRGFIDVSLNDSLESLSLPELQWTVDSLKLSENDTLSTLNLQQLDYIGDSLVLLDLPQMTTVVGLNGVVDIEGYLWIEMTGVIDLYGLASLEHISETEGKLKIIDNPALTNIDKLQDLQVNSGNGYVVNGDVDIIDNALEFGDQDAQDLVDSWGGPSTVSGTITISGN